MSAQAAIDSVRVDAYTIPTDAPEADGTFAWDSTTLVVVLVDAGGRSGLGYTYAHRAAGMIVAETLAPLLCGRNALDTQELRADATAALRNIGYPGVGAMALSALDIALWDLKGHLLGASLPDLFGSVHAELPAYGSGGFTSYSDDRLCAQLADWAGQGFARVKMKVGSEPDRDPARVAAARAAIGPDVGLMVDANGAYARAQALAMAEHFAEQRVDWYEEPVSSDDLEGLHGLRGRLPPGIEVSAGEYGWDAHYFARMLEAGAVDVLQADATRCGGYSGFLEVASLARALHVPLSAHCAPALHAPVCAAVPDLRHLECFHDHMRVEAIAFDGVAPMHNGALVPQRERPGHGLSLRAADLARYHA